jgi:hypothetical protein
MTESSPNPDLANAQVTGGGGHEPDPDQTPTDPPEPANAGSGVDLKSSELPDPED